MDAFLVLLQRINASLSLLQAERKTAACRRNETKGDCLGHEFCFVPIGNRPQGSEMWQWGGIPIRHPEGCS